VLELVALGSLDRVLLHLQDVLRVHVKLSMCEQICAGMAELAQEGVLHRDLAARNVLVQSIDPAHVKVGRPLRGTAITCHSQMPVSGEPTSNGACGWK
jgi:serine/threonine protein kinase